MGRPPRIHYPGAIYHAMSRGNGGRPIYTHERDWQRFTALIGEAKSRLGFELFAYCLMPNHFHLLIRVSQVPLSRIMQQILCWHAKRYNLMRNRKGHLFQSRYKAVHCADETYAMGLVRYIHLNPVRAGIVEKPSQWTWSSHEHYLGLRTDPIVDSALPLESFSDDALRAVQSYADFVGEGLRPSVLRAYPIAFTEVQMSTTKFRRPRPADGVQLSELAADVAEETGVRVDEIRSRSRVRRISAARRCLIRRALARGLRTSVVAGFVSRHPSFVARIGSPAG